MLGSLKLGSTSTSITLTPSDANITSSFMLPQVAETIMPEEDRPEIYGPIPGDSGSGATNYGYLYNWPAATAGATTTGVTSGSAPHSICPAGWRLPTGGVYESGQGEFAELDRLFGGAGNYQNSGPSETKWGYDGPFKGVFAGYARYSIMSSGNYGSLWSSTTSNMSTYAAAMTIQSGYLSPTGYAQRMEGLAVRCLVN